MSFGLYSIWVRAGDCRADLRSPFDACPYTLDCRGCNRTAGLGILTGVKATRQRDPLS
jgi:hypothetical protein